MRWRLRTVSESDSPCCRPWRCSGLSLCPERRSLISASRLLITRSPFSEELNESLIGWRLPRAVLTRGSGVQLEPDVGGDPVHPPSVCLTGDQHQAPSRGPFKVRFGDRPGEAVPLIGHLGKEPALVKPYAQHDLALIVQHGIGDDLADQKLGGGEHAIAEIRAEQCSEPGPGGAGSAWIAAQPEDAGAVARPLGRR